MTTSAEMTAQPNGRMYGAISTAMIGAIMFGVDCGNFGAVQGFQSFQRAWCEGNYGDADSCGSDKDVGAAANDEWLTQFVSPASVLIFVGAACGSLVLAPILSSRLGRRPCVSVGACICLLGCLLTSYISLGSVGIFLAGRFLTGFGIGVCCFALPLYNSEMSTPSIRGTTGSLFQLNVSLGGVLAATVTFLNHDWRIGMMLPGFAGGVVMLAVWLMPESPRFVMATAGYEAGVSVLSQVRSGDVTSEATEMNAQLVEEKAAGQVSYADILTDPSLRKRVFISCWLQVAQQFTGMNTLIMYSATLFTEMGFANPFKANLVFNALMVVGMIAGLALLDSRVGGRRTQLLAVTTVIGPLLIVIGFAVSSSWDMSLELFLVCAFAFVWQMAWGMVPWIYPSELFTMAERDRATSFAVFSQYAANAVLMFVDPFLMSALGVPGTFMFFGAFNLLNLAFVYVFIKETRGVPLECVPALFGEETRKCTAKKPTDEV